MTIQNKVENNDSTTDIPSSDAISSDTEIIMRYASEECGMSQYVQQKTLKKFDEHQDIKEELIHWIQTREYEKDAPIEIEGYSAENIAQLAPFMNAIGVYSFLISLRTNTEWALQTIKDGFPRK